MVAKSTIYVLVFSCLWCISRAYIQVGIILRKEDEGAASIVENVFKTPQNGDTVQNLDIRLLKEIVDKEDVASVHRAFCRLLAQGIVALLSPSALPYYSILCAYANEYKIPFITTGLTEATLNIPNEVSVQPSTTRAILGLFQLYGWKDVVYIYDHEFGPENLQFIFLLGHRVLNLIMDGILKVSSAEEAMMYFRKLDKSFKNKYFHVILDTNPSMAREILWRHVNDIHVRKTNFHFVLSQPTLENFWVSERVAFEAINVTTFIIPNQLRGKETSEQKWMRDTKLDSNISLYYFHDAALVLMQAVEKLLERDSSALQTNISTEKRDCLANLPIPISRGESLTRLLKRTNIKDGFTGEIQFEGSMRKDFDLSIMQINNKGFRQIGTWSKGILLADSISSRKVPTTLPLILNNRRLKIVTIISPPYMMLKNSENGSILHGNDRFEGFCKDMLDSLADEMRFEYDLHLVEDGAYGEYDGSKAEWTGIIGEIIQRKADLAVADLPITAERQRVVDFTDPYEMAGFSLVLKNPQTISKLSSMFFVFSAFTVDVWICILFIVFVFAALFHLITKFTGAPDSIESASGIWGRKHAIVVNLWFTVGSSMLQGTGVYPRSISSRVLSGVCWFFTLILSALFIASITAQIRTGTRSSENNPQLAQIKELSLETIIAESVSRGWPKVGLVYRSETAVFINKSSIQTLKKYAKYLENNPDVLVRTPEEGLKRVQESKGDYMLLLNSLTGEYAARQKPCDLIATHDSINFIGYGLATPLGSKLTLDINVALNALQNRGLFGHLYRKWWIESSQCKKSMEENGNGGTIHVVSGLMCVAAVGFLIILGVFGIQYIRKNQSKESRRQQLSFEDMNLDQTFPAPPPELLAEPAPVLNLPEYDKRTLL